MIDLDKGHKNRDSCILTKTILRFWECVIKQSLEIIFLCNHIVVVFVVFNNFLQDAAGIKIIFFSLVGA